MSRIEYEVDINSPVERVYEYYTIQTILKRLGPVTSSKNQNRLPILKMNLVLR